MDSIVAEPPEIKFLFLILFGLGGLANLGKSEAVLPAYLVGLWQALCARYSRGNSLKGYCGGK